MVIDWGSKGGVRVKARDLLMVARSLQPHLDHVVQGLSTSCFCSTIEVTITSPPLELSPQISLSGLG